MDEIRATREIDWIEERAEEAPVRYQTQGRPGRLRQWVERQQQQHAEATARYARDHGGVPPPEYQTSSRTYKSDSRIRFPSEAFRRNYDQIDWSH